MFETICIRPNESTFPTDIGFLAENLLYYDKVILIAATDTVPILFNNCDPDYLIEFLGNGNLKIMVRENILGTMATTMQDGNIVYDVALISTKNLTAEEVVFHGLLKATGRRGYSKRVTEKMMNFIEPVKYEKEVCDSIRDDLEDEWFVKQSIIDTLQFYNPELVLTHKGIHYKKVRTEKGFLFETNLNFEEINKHTKHIGAFISPHGLILNIQETRGDMHMAAALGGEIATTPIQARLLKLKFNDIYQKSLKSSDGLFKFNDFILDSGYAIREAINSGERNFKDLLELMVKASKFKDWLKNIEDDKNILKEYHNAVTKETWAEKLPGKTLRWVIFTGLGFAVEMAGGGGVGTVAGLGISAGDNFLLDKFIKGWKPSVFVDSELKPRFGKKL